MYKSVHNPNIYVKKIKPLVSRENDFYLHLFVEEMYLWTFLKLTSDTKYCFSWFVSWAHVQLSNAPSNV